MASQKANKCKKVSSSTNNAPLEVIWEYEKSDAAEYVLDEIFDFLFSKSKLQ